VPKPSSVRRVGTTLKSTPSRLNLARPLAPMSPAQPLQLLQLAGLREEAPRARASARARPLGLRLGPAWERQSSQALERERRQAPARMQKMGSRGRTRRRGRSIDACQFTTEEKTNR